MARRVGGEVMRNGAALLLVAVAPGAMAQTAPPAIAELERCRAIADPGARLACFDTATTAVLAAYAAGTLAADRPADDFPRRLGLTDPVRTGPAPSRAERARDEVREITTTVASFRAATGRGAYYLKLANGQLWRTLGRLAVEPRANASIRISTTVTGGFRASIGRGTPVFVERVL